MRDEILVTLDEDDFVEAYRPPPRPRRLAVLLLLLFHFMCQSVIESTFEVQQELSFDVLFLFLFYYHPPESPGRQPAGRAT